jgi:hypothetical protein
MPTVIRTNASTVASDPAVAALVHRLRAASDACLFVSGGAGHMEPRHRARVGEALDAVPRVQRAGPRLVVGDGGTRSGVMELLGNVRAGTHGAFPLVGIVPARAVPPLGETPLDPNHSHIVAVDDPSWPPDRDAWGLETPAMFTLFGQLAAGRAAAALVANGGRLALDEVERHVQAGWPVIVLAGSGRVADAIARGLGHDRGGLEPVDAPLARELDRRAILASPERFTVVSVADGPAALADVLRHALGGARLPRP